MAEERKEPRPLGALPANPRAVLVDAMGTLVTLEPPHARLREILERETGVHVSSARAKEAFGAEIAYYLEHHLEGRDPESLALLRDRCAMVIEESLGDPRFTHDIVREAMLDAITFHAYADSAPALRAFREGGLRIVVCSNWDCSLPDVLADAGLLHLVDEVVSSASAGFAKPDLRIFEAALVAARCEPGEAIHVGDSLEGDIGGALAAGVPAVLVDRVGDGGPAPPGTPLVRTLTELSAALAAGGRMLRE
jgi:putative hydrolase of the HAD superfamily